MSNYIVSLLASILKRAANLELFYFDLTDPQLKKIPHILGISEGSGAKSYMTNDLLIYDDP